MGNTVEIAVEIKHVTDRAVLVFDGDNEFWVPRSLIEDFDPNDNVINVQEWFAEKEGMI